LQVGRGRRRAIGDVDLHRRAQTANGADHLHGFARVDAEARERIDALAHGLGHLVRGLRGAQDALGHGVGLVLRQIGLLGDVDHARREIHRGLARQNQRGGHGGPAQHIVGAGTAQAAPRWSIRLVSA
jgi:hypothetical protein